MRAMQPLSAQKLAAPSATPATSSRSRARQARPNPYLASGAAALPTNRQLAKDALRDLVTRGTLRPAPLAALSPASSACGSKVDLDDALGAVRVAVLVAMPSPRHRHVVGGDEKAQWRAEGEGLREYVVGIAEAKVA